MTTRSIILLWVILTPVVSLGYPTLSLLFAGLMPTIVSFVTEENHDHARTLSIGVFNICGVLPFTFEVLEKKQAFSYILQLLKNPDTWLVMYGAASLGYLIYLGVPSVILGAMRITALMRINRLKREQKRLEEEWGDVISPEKRQEEVSKVQKKSTEN
tara:strand:+ start:306 stop:779 length:474 start_codon:yes stop_codon:yes gene_type:complete